MSTIVRGTLAWLFAATRTPEGSRHLYACTSGQHCSTSSNEIATPLSRYTHSLNYVHGWSSKNVEAGLAVANDSTASREPVARSCANAHTSTAYCFAHDSTNPHVEGCAAQRVYSALLDVPETSASRPGCKLACAKGWEGSRELELSLRALRGCLRMLGASML